MSQNAFIDGLGYEGKVTLTLKSNGRVLKTKTYKNSGTNQLFKFLGYCLMGAYDDVKSLLPTQVMLLYNEVAADVGPTADAYNKVEKRSAPRGLAQTPTIVSGEPRSDQDVKVTYSFEIPRASITGPFNQVALYGAGMSEVDYLDFSAYYYLVDDYGDSEALDPEDWSATAVLLIEWELSLSNKIAQLTYTI